MKEKIERSAKSENIKNGIQIALTIGLIGSLLAYVGYDYHKNSDQYLQRAQDRITECQTNPNECLDPTMIGLFIDW